MYESDSPIADKSQDRLNRYAFSSALAKTILNLSTTDVFTIGLYGKWGSGKTSIINMALQEISTISESLPDTKKPIVMQFNPWNYSDANQLMQQFFSCLSNALNVQTKGSKLPEIGKTIKEYSEALELAEWIPVVGKYIKALQLVVTLSGETLTHSAKEDLNISRIKEKITDALQKETRKIIIVIDDIDRLSNKEIQMIFQLVNAVASFPNVVYLLSFDYAVVTRALKDVQNCDDGGEYLEKIIQVPFEIPAASKRLINQVFFDSLNKILLQFDYTDDFDREYWNNTLWNIINPCIDSIRSVKRLLNTFQLKLGLMSSELNWIDLLSVTALQVFHSPIYQWIQGNKTMLLDTTYQYKGISGIKQKGNKAEFLAQFKLVAPQQSQYMLDCTTTLFPQFAWSVGESYTGFDADYLRRSRRIASTENFDFYFTLSLADIPISNSTLNQILHVADKKMINEYIKMFISGDKFIDFLTALRGYESVIPQDRLIIMTSALMLSFGKSNEESISSMIPQSADNLIEHIVIKYLTAVKEPQTRAEVWIDTLLDMSADNLPGMATLINREELAHGRLAGESENPEHQLLQLDALLQVEAAYLQKISEIVKDTSLLSISFWMPAYLWEAFDLSGYQQYISSELKESDVNKCRFIAGYASEWKSLTSYDEVGWSFEPSKFEKYLSIEEAHSAVENCIQDGSIFSLPQRIQEKLAAFILFLSPSVKEKDRISQKKARLFMSMWKEKKTLESVDWDKMEQ